MFLMFADEADRQQNRGQPFFVYGAVFIPSDRAAALHTAIEALRVERGYGPGDALKFADHDRPAHIDRNAHRQIKSRVIELAAEHGVAFCAYVTLHALARNRTHEELVTWGANTLLGKFNEYCGDVNQFGMAFFDRMPIAHEHRFFREKFTIGLRFPNGATRRLDRVIGLASTCDSASHMSSVADIVLGSFRYCANEVDRDIAGRAMYPAIVRLMWKRVYGGRIFLADRGLVMRPTRVQEQPHRQAYEGLVDRLRGYLA